MYSKHTDNGGAHSQVGEGASASEEVRAEVSEAVVWQVQVAEVLEAAHACGAVQGEQLIVAQVSEGRIWG